MGSHELRHHHEARPEVRDEGSDGGSGGSGEPAEDSAAPVDAPAGDGTAEDAAAKAKNK